MRSLTRRHPLCRRCAAQAPAHLTSIRPGTYHSSAAHTQVSQPVDSCIHTANYTYLRRVLRLQYTYAVTLRYALLPSQRPTVDMSLYADRAGLVNRYIL